jgi:methylthioribose-1-phosphate isomerase
VEPNQQKKIIKLLSALIGASAIVVMAVLAVALNEEQTVTGTVSTEAVGGMSTGATVTTTTPPTAAPVPVAQPTMKAVVPKGFR